MYYLRTIRNHVGGDILCARGIARKNDLVIDIFSIVLLVLFQIAFSDIPIVDYLNIKRASSSNIDIDIHLYHS